MFPNADYLPAAFMKDSRVQLIALAVPLEFRDPVVSVHSRHPTVGRATMPETAVDEYRDPTLSEDYVRPDSMSVNLERVVAAISQSAAMECRPQRQLWGCVATTIRLHVPTAWVRLRVRGQWHDWHELSIGVWKTR